MLGEEADFPPPIRVAAREHNPVTPRKKMSALPLRTLRRLCNGVV
jgi:hypothetical protein